MEFIKTFNLAIFILVTAMYAYQMFYVIVALIGDYRDKKKSKAPFCGKQHRFGVVISARNESSVIGQLVDTLKMQKYPKELLEVFVASITAQITLRKLQKSTGQSSIGALTRRK